MYTLDALLPIQCPAGDVTPTLHRQARILIEIWQDLVLSFVNEPLLYYRRLEGPKVLKGTKVSQDYHSLLIITKLPHNPLRLIKSYVLTQFCLQRKYSWPHNGHHI